MQGVFRYLLIATLVFMTKAVVSQNYGKDLSLSVSGKKTATGTLISWKGEYDNPCAVYRKGTIEEKWTLLSASATNFFLDSLSPSKEVIEYKVVMTNQPHLNESYEQSFGYVSVDNSQQLDMARKGVLVLVDSSLAVNLKTELQHLGTDLILDGYNYSFQNIPSHFNPKEVKAIIQSYYAKDSITYVYLIGHIAVPYSGFHAPDGHSDHYGAWPADGYYADMTENTWTELPFFHHTNTRDSRNSNIAQDGKFDQSSFPTSVELIVARIDFSDLPVYEKSELELTREYLNRASSYKRSELTIQTAGLIDDNLQDVADGFGNNFYRNFSGTLGTENWKEGDFLIDLAAQNYLCAVATSFANDTATEDIGSSRDVSQIPTNAVLKLLTGSYFGDWDTENNFLRANLASGTTLNTIWAGRPNLFLHELLIY